MGSEMCIRDSAGTGASGTEALELSITESGVAGTGAIGIVVSVLLAWNWERKGI